MGSRWRSGRFFVFFRAVFLRKSVRAPSCARVRLCCVGVRLTLGVLCAAPAPPAPPPLDAKTNGGDSVVHYCMQYNKNPDVAKMLRVRAIRRGAAQPGGRCWCCVLQPEAGMRGCCHWLRFCRLPACSLSHPARQQSTAPDGCRLTLMSFSAPPACLPAAPGCRRTLSVGAAGVTCLLRGAASSMRPN